jgi:hypothetical protein
MHLSAHCFNIKSICFKCGDRFNGDYKETDEARARRYRSGGGCLHFRCAGCCRNHPGSSAPGAQGRKVQITLTIAEPLLDRVDELAGQIGQSRAAVINLA